jgi:hypothetical protein
MNSYTHWWRVFSEASLCTVRLIGSVLPIALFAARLPNSISDDRIGRYISLGFLFYNYKLPFFKAKTIAMHAELPARLQRKDFNGIKHMLLND